MTNQANQILSAYTGVDRYTIAKNTPATGKLIAECILEVVAVAIENGFRIDAVMIDGSTLVIKKTSTKKPSTVQLHAEWVNFNVKRTLPGSLFTFSKRINQEFSESHLKTYLVK